MPSFDVNRLLEEDEAVRGMDVPYRFGKKFDVDYTLSNGNWQKTDSGKIWFMKFVSKGAFSINFVFSKLTLPEGARMYVYNTEGSMVYGPVTSKQNIKEGLFITDIIKGESVILYLFVPENAFSEPVLEISAVIHGYKDMFKGIFKTETELGSSGYCEQNVACYPGWELESRAVAKTIVGGGNYTCSGSLINNTAQNYRAFFLSAFHCIDINNNGSISTKEEKDGKNWTFIF